MRNVIKYDSANLQPDSIKSGNFNISTKLIPTNPSGFYNGITPIIGGYTIYVNKPSGGPSIYSPKNDSELVGVSQSLGGIPTTNLFANAQLSTYNNVPSDISSVLVQTSEKYKGATVWKQTLTPLTANGVSWLSNGNNPGIGVLLNGGGGLANRFTGYSIFFKPTVPMYTNPIYTYYSNVVGYQSSRNYDDMGDGWFRAHVIWFDTVTRSDNKYWAINPLSSTLNTPIDIYWAGPFKEDRNDSLKVASFVNGTRGTTATDSLTWLNDQSNMTVVNENYPNIVTEGLVLNLDAGFVSSYPKTGTTWRDLSGNGNNGSLLNGTSYNSENWGSLFFDGIDDKVNVPHISSYNLSTLTVLVWIKPTSPYTEGFRAIISKQGADRDWNFYLYSSASNGVVNYYHFSTARASSYPSLVSIPGNSLTLDVWHQCGFSISNGVLTYYLDGVAIASGAINFSSANSSYPITIGGADNYTKGNIMTSQVYNRGLTDQEVLQNYYAGLQRFIPKDGLVLSLDAQNTNLYATSSTTAYDISGNGNNGTLTNGVQYISDGGGSWMFDGIDDYISFNYTQPEQTTSTSFSWNVWVYPTRNYAGDIIMGNRNNILAFTKLTTTNFEYYPTNLGGNTPINQWINLCVVKDGTNLYYYRNSTLIGSATSSGTKTSLPFFIGGDPIAGEYFKGNVSQAQIYNRALTQSEITTIYNATKSRYGIQ